MSLIKCPECGGQISEKAVNCPHCGCEISFCHECGSAFVGRKEKCPNCGFNLTNNEKDTGIVCVANQIKFGQKKEKKGLTEEQQKNRAFAIYRYVLGGLVFLFGAIILIVAATPFVQVGHVGIANVYEIMFCILSDKSGGIYYLSRLTIPALIFFLVGLCSCISGLTIMLNNKKSRLPLSKNKKVAKYIVKYIFGALIVCLMIIYCNDVSEYYAIDCKKYNTILIISYCFFMVEDIIQLKWLNVLRDKNYITADDLLISENTSKKGAKFAVFFACYLILSSALTPLLISRMAYGKSHFIGCGEYDVVHMKVGSTLLIIKDENDFCEQINDEDKSKNREKVHYERYSSNYQFWAKTTKEFEAKLQKAQEDMQILAQYMLLNGVGSLAGVDLGEFTGLSSNEIKDLYVAKGKEIAILEDAKSIAQDKLKNLHFSKISVWCEYVQNGRAFYRTISYLELDRDCCLNKEDKIKWGKEKRDNLKNPLAKESLKLNETVFSKSNTNFSTEKIIATITYNDGSYKSYYITPKNANELNNANRGTHELLWEDAWGSYSYSITIT